jgi:hydroxyacid-oxoacid transhydrogenase
MASPCCHLYADPRTDSDDGAFDSPFDSRFESAFGVDTNRIVFGRRALVEVGAHARALGMSRVALFTDERVGKLRCFFDVVASLKQAGLDWASYDAVRVEPSDRSMLDGAAFLRDGRFDGVVSLGGGSVIDSAKAASLYASQYVAWPADFLTYVNAPLGAGAAVPGALLPHIACPTTSGTGSECTGIAICTLTLGRFAEKKLKTGIVHRALRPTLALIDPTTTYSLPAGVVAASGSDVLCHALESYTARPYNQRPRPENPMLRPMSQGRNPWSDLGSLEALRLCGQYLLRATRDAGDHEARDHMMYAATLAGIAFGNAGVHLPHGMAYAIACAPSFAGFAMPGYDHDVCGPLLPHGVSVILAAPAALRFTARACADRHLRAAEALGAELRGATFDDAGAILGDRLIELLRGLALPNGLSAIGYSAADVGRLCEGTQVQARLLSNAPCPIDGAALAAVFADAMTYWPEKA